MADRPGNTPAPEEPVSSPPSPAWTFRTLGAPLVTPGIALVSHSLRLLQEIDQFRRWIWRGAKLWATGISSIVLTLTWLGSEVAQSTASAISSAVKGCMPA